MRLRLKGFVGIKAGSALDWSGLDEIAIDFTGRNGLTTFDGECGSGKSTVLECMHHYPQLVSRDGALWKHTFLRDSEKEFENTFMGNQYRSLLKIDPQTEKTEGYMWVNGKPVVNGKISAYKEYVYNLFGHPFTYFRSQFCPQKSKKTKDMQIENMTAGVFKQLLSEFLYLQQYAEKQETAKQCATAIAAQMNHLGSRIDSLQEKVKGQQDAKTAYALEQIKAENLGTQKIGLTENLSHFRARAEDLKKVIAKNDLLEQRRADLSTQIRKLESDLETETKAAADEKSVLAEKYRELKAELDKTNQVLEEKEAVLHAAEKEKEYQAAIDSLSLEIEQISEEITKHHETVHTLEMEIQTLETSLRDLDNDKELRAILDEITSLEGMIRDNKHDSDRQVTAFEGQIKDLDNDQVTKDFTEQLASVTTAIADREKELKDLDNDRDLQRMEMDIQNLESRVAERSRYEFLPGQPCLSTTCPAVAAATKAEEDLPAAKEECETRRRDIEAKKQSVRGIIESLSQEKESLLSRLANRKTEVEDERTRLTAGLEGSKKLTQSAIEDLTRQKEQADARKESRVQKIEAEKTHHAESITAKRRDLNPKKKEVLRLTEKQSMLRKEIATHRHSIAKQKELAAKLNDIQVAIARKTDLDKQVAEIVEQGQAKKRAWEARQSRFLAEINTLQKNTTDIEESIVKSAPDDLKEVEASIIYTENTEIPAINKEIADVHASLSAMKASMDAMQSAETELVEAQAERNRFAQEVADWTYLRTAVGKDLPAAEIDGAAPLIIADANDLLSKAYGTLYSIRLQTFDEATGQECLNVKIITESGKEVDLDNISGGQRVWNVQSLWLAMSLLNQKKSRRQFDYFCADEQDGALDIENARRFAALYEPFMRIGGFKDLFYISHKPECRALAANVLKFEAGKNPVWG